MIDFFLFSAVFVAIARLTLEKSFPGKPGKALAVAVGLILALSLSLAERRFGFSIRAFSPIAIGIVVGLVGLVVFHLCRKAGAASPTAGSLALIIVYFSLRAVMPGFFAWVESNRWMSFVHALLLLAVFVALWRVIAGLFSSHHDRLGNLSASIDHAGPSSEFEPERVSGKRELGLLKHRLSRFVRRGVKDSRRIIEELQEMIEIIREHGTDRKGMQLISRKLKEMQPKRHNLLRELDRIRKADKRLKQFNLSDMADLNARYKRLSPEQKKRCQTQFIENRVKLNVETEMTRLAEESRSYQEHFTYSVEMAVKHLTAHDANGATGWLEKAVEQERTAEKLLEEILALEKKVINLVRRQLRQIDSKE